jgi:hypothetical protein
MFSGLMIGWFPLSQVSPALIASFMSLGVEAVPRQVSPLTLLVPSLAVVFPTNVLY